MRGLEFYTKQLSRLVGGKVTGVVNDEAEEFFGLKIKVGRKEKILWFMEDNEGNGPGSFEIQEE